MGLPILFNGKADFSGILRNDSNSDISLYVSRVAQQAVIEVDEEGTTAAAATCNFFFFYMWM